MWQIVRNCPTSSSIAALIVSHSPRLRANEVSIWLNGWTAFQLHSRQQQLRCIKKTCRRQQNSQWPPAGCDLVREYLCCRAYVALRCMPRMPDGSLLAPITRTTGCTVKNCFANRASKKQVHTNSGKKIIKIIGNLTTVF